MTARGGGSDAADEGAAAVEFALVSVLLFTLLFGIMQFGMLFFEMQAASNTARDAARLAAVGITNCGTFRGSIQTVAEQNQLHTDLGSAWLVTATFSGGTTAQPEWVDVSVRFSPTDFNLPFVPFPGDLTRTARARVGAVGTVRTSC